MIKKKRNRDRGRKRGRRDQETERKIVGWREEENEIGGGVTLSVQSSDH